MCWGYVRNVLGPLSPGALFLVTHHQAFSAAYSASSLPLCSLTHMHGHTHMHQPAGTNTPPGQCVPWSLTLNRPPRLNTTDRQASGHQVHQVTHGGWVEKRQPVVSTCLLLHVKREKGAKARASVLVTQSAPLGLTAWCTVTLILAICQLSDRLRCIFRFFFFACKHF